MDKTRRIVLALDKFVMNLTKPSMDALFHNKRPLDPLAPHHPRGHPQREQRTEEAMALYNAQHTLELFLVNLMRKALARVQFHLASHHVQVCILNAHGGSQLAIDPRLFGHIVHQCSKVIGGALPPCLKFLGGSCTPPPFPHSPIGSTHCAMKQGRTSTFKKINKNPSYGRQRISRQIPKKSAL